MYPQSMFGGGYNEYPQSMFWSKTKKNIEFLLMKFSIFTGEKNLYILHGQVFVLIPAEMSPPVADSTKEDSKATQRRVGEI